MEKRVTGCGDCPFLKYNIISDKITYCGIADDDDRVIDDNGSDVLITPNFCPLKQGSVVVSMFPTDAEMMKHYKLGWADCVNIKTFRKFTDLDLQKAYIVGYNDCLSGNADRMLDYQTDEQILGRIKI